VYQLKISPGQRIFKSEMEVVDHKETGFLFFFILRCLMVSGMLVQEFKNAL
jgi:hypothetical protein